MDLAVDTDGGLYHLLVKDDALYLHHTQPDCLRLETRPVPITKARSLYEMVEQQSGSEVEQHLPGDMNKCSTKNDHISAWRNIMI